MDVRCIEFHSQTDRPNPAPLLSVRGQPGALPALTYVVVNIRKVTANAPPPSEFEVSVTFGPVMDTRLGIVYMSGSNTTSGKKGGTGTVLVKDSGKDPTVSFDLQPQAGIVIKGTISCTNALRY